MTRETHDRWRDDLAAFMLGALAPVEAREVEQHLAHCSRCQEDERRLRVSVGALGDAVPQIEPPAELRQRIVGSARAERRGSVRARLRPVLRPAASFGATAAVAVAVGALLAGDDRVGDATTISAAATPAAPAADAHLVVGDESAHLVVDRLPPPRRDRVYQLWIRHGERIVPSTLFTVDRHGRGAAAIPGGLSETADEVMVSEEPVRGSTVPSTPPRLRVALS